LWWREVDNVRGGLDDALERLARRDRLRREADRQAGGPPPAVAELVEAIAEVVGRNPDMALTIGVEGAGAPVILHVAMEDGVVRVTATDPPDTLAADQAYDFEVDAEDTPRHAHSSWSTDVDQEPNGYDPQLNPYGAPPYDDEVSDDSETVNFDRESVLPPHMGASYETRVQSPYVVPPPATRPSVPPQQRTTSPSVQPPPLARPIPLKVEEPEETEQAAKRLAALLREDPSLLQ
jgi:hypothetical protein